jgi:hypothetical protein
VGSAGGLTRQRHSELGFNVSLCAFDKGWGRLLILLLASILQSTLAASQELPDLPSAVMRTSSYAAGDSATSADPQQSPAAAVSVTRFTSLQHFPSDVVVGSTLGYSIGRHIFHAHCKAGLSAK